MSREERLPPNYSKLDRALRSIGYSFDVAVADIIDNSIDARARNVLVRILPTEHGHLDLAMWDDGSGMTGRTLKEAMRFGANVTDEIDRLGKFGLGLKLASLSQAKEVHVITAKNGVLSGRAWLEQGIARGFTSTIYDKSECETLLTQIIPDCKSGRSGTLVLWSQLYRLGRYHGGADEQAQKLLHRLANHLRLAFHRFLAGRPRKVAIRLDIFDRETRKGGIPLDLDPLDPFGYNVSGQKGFPALMKLDGAHATHVTMRAHIWPPNSTAAEYKLPGGANSRQGFYFYRSNRLIQASGWNGIRETEPHASLARVEIDLATTLDLDVSLDVKKVEIQLPADLVSSIQKARTSSGIDLKKYLALADATYRTRKATYAELPLIPSVGLPAELTAYLHDELRLKGTAKHRDLKIKWKELKRKEFFAIDREAGELFLNRAFRPHLLHGLTGSAADIPVLKCLLFLVLEEALTTERLSSKLRERLDRVNRILAKAVRYERVQ